MKLIYTRRWRSFDNDSSASCPPPRLKLTARSRVQRAIGHFVTFGRCFVFQASSFSHPITSLSLFPYLFSQRKISNLILSHQMSNMNECNARKRSGLRMSHREIKKNFYIFLLKNAVAESSLSHQCESFCIEV